jgi:IS5 family transposase
MGAGNSFADLMVTQKSQGTTKLEKIHGLVRWERFRYRLKKILDRSGQGPTGYDPLQLFQVLLLQNLYGLSDPEMEEMLYDRISFRRFCNFGLSDKIPDETTLCRFRGALQGHTEKLFQMVMEEIAKQGIKVKSGAIVDATVIKSSVRPPKGGEVSKKDPEAGWTKKGGKYIHGYKAHIASDKDTGLIKRVIATSGDVHDSQVFAPLLKGDEEEVYADKAYGSSTNRELLRSHGIEDKILFKRSRGMKDLPSWQVNLNKLWGKTRCNIERIFAHWKTGMGLQKSRYKGWDRHQVHFDLMAMAYNLSRSISLLRKQTG